MSPTNQETTSRRPGKRAAGLSLRAAAAEEAKLGYQCRLRSEAAESQGRKHDAQTEKLKEIEHDEKAKDYHRQAADEIFRAHNSKHPAALGGSGSSKTPRLNRCDLHGLYVEEAIGFVRKHIEHCIEERRERTIVITGAGKHSRGGRPRLKPAVLKFLREPWQVSEHPGASGTEGVKIVAIHAHAHKTNLGCISVSLSFC